MRKEAVAALLRVYMQQKLKTPIRPKSSELIVAMWVRKAGFSTLEMCTMLDCSKTHLSNELCHLRRTLGDHNLPERNTSHIQPPLIVSEEILALVDDALAWAQEEEK